jgi:hypothetical protein
MLLRIPTRCHRLLANGTIRLASAGGHRGEIIRRRRFVDAMRAFAKQLSGRKGGRNAAFSCERSPARMVRSSSVEGRSPRRNSLLPRLRA